MEEKQMNKIIFIFMAILAFIGCSMPGDPILPPDVPDPVEETIGVVPLVWFGDWTTPSPAMRNVAYNDPPPTTIEPSPLELYAVQMTPVITGWKEDKETKVGEKLETNFHNKKMTLSTEKIDDDRIKMKGDIDDGGNFTIDFNHKDKTFNYTQKIIYDVYCQAGTVTLITFTSITGGLVKEDKSYTGTGTTWYYIYTEGTSMAKVDKAEYEVTSFETNGNNSLPDYKIKVTSLLEMDTTNILDISYDLTVEDLEALLTDPTPGFTMTINHSGDNGWTIPSE